MTLSTENVATQSLSLPEELILTLLNEESGYFHQVPGWNLNCAVVGAVLAELTLRSHIDTDMESLFLLNRTETGNPALDPILEEITRGPTRQNAQYWIERLAPHAESIVDLTLERLVDLKILEHHDGDFYTLARSAGQVGSSNGSREATDAQFVKTRISRAILDNEIPHPRDVIIICLINTCDVFRFMFQLDEEAEEPIEFICKMDLIGRSIADAVAENLAGPLLRHSALSKRIPAVSLRKLLLNPHIRDGNIPALFADLTQEYGPVFEIRPPFAKPMIILGGLETNRWVHRRGRVYLRTVDPSFGFLNSLVARVEQADGGDGNRSAVRIGFGQRVERSQDLWEALNRVDIRLSDRLVGVHLEQSPDQKRGRDDRIARRQQFSHTRIADHVIYQGVHLRQPLGCERLPTEEQGYNTGFAGIPEELNDISQGVGDGVILGKRRRGLRRRRAPRRPCGQQDRNDDDDEYRDVWAGRDQTAQPTWNVAHGPPLYLRTLGEAAGAASLLCSRNSLLLLLAPSSL